METCRYCRFFETVGNKCHFAPPVVTGEGILADTRRPTTHHFSAACNEFVTKEVTKEGSE